MDKSWNDMTIFQGKIIVWTEDVRRNNTCKLTTILFMVSTILDINHPFRIGIAKIGRMRRSIVYHGFVDRIVSFIGEYAGGQTGNAFHDLLTIYIGGKPRHDLSLIGDDNRSKLDRSPTLLV